MIHRFRDIAVRSPLSGGNPGFRFRQVTEKDLAGWLSIKHTRRCFLATPGQYGQIKKHKIRAIPFKYRQSLFQRRDSAEYLHSDTGQNLVQMQRLDSFSRHDDGGSPVK